jgi:hypothetical protein
MDNLIFLVVGFALGLAQRHWWPEPWPYVWGLISSSYVWGLISSLWKSKPPAVS